MSHSWPKRSTTWPARAYCEIEDVDRNEYLRRLWGEGEKDAEGADDDEVGADDEEEEFDDADDEEREDSYYDQPFDRRWDKRLPRLMKLVFHRPGEVNPSSEFMKPIKADGLQGIFTPSAKSKRLVIRVDQLPAAALRRCPSCVSCSTIWPNQASPKARSAPPSGAGRSTLAECPNVACKLSGMVTEAGPQWTVDALRPFVAIAVRAFGTARLMFG